MRAIFDSHVHIVDPAFPLIANQGFVPDPFPVAAYRDELDGLDLAPIGGAVVSGSFQGQDASYLVPALAALGPTWRAVIALTPEMPEADILRLHALGVRAMRVNLRRGAPDGAGGGQLDGLEATARRIWDLCGWHVEFYVDAALLPDIGAPLARLPKIAVDHVGLSEAGLPHLLALVAGGAAIKATGFGRYAGDIAAALARVHSENPAALMFGTDLPSTRAPRRFGSEDLDILDEVFGTADRRAVEVENGAAFYGVTLEA